MRSVFLYSREEAVDIWLRLGLSKENVTAYIVTISGFCFYWRQIRKPSFTKVASCKLNERYGKFLAEYWVWIMKRQPKAGVVSFVIKCQLHRIWNYEFCLLLCFFGIRVNFNVERVSVRWDLQRVVVEIWSKLSRDDFKMHCDASFDVIWQINPYLFSGAFSIKDTR